MDNATHTPEPWFVSNQYGELTSGEHVYSLEIHAKMHGFTCMVADLNTYKLEPGAIGCGGNPAANGERIVACVNACEGIPTEALNGGVVKDLLGACKDLVEIRMPEITGPIHPVGSWQDRLRQAVSHAKDAIAKAEGKVE